MTVDSSDSMGNISRHKPNLKHRILKDQETDICTKKSKTYC